jgi:hypothetical protein
MEREGGFPCRLLPYLQARTSPSCNVIGKGVRIVSVLSVCMLRVTSTYVCKMGIRFFIFV